MKKFDTKQLTNLPIKEVANKLGLQLRNNRCLCFIHEEKTPSFHIYPQKNMWKCFGCGEGGNVINLVQKYNNCDFTEACKWLSNSFGIASYNVKRISASQKKVERKKTENHHKADIEIYKWVFDNLTVTDNVKDFIANRHYPNNVIEQYNLKGIDDCGKFFEKSKEKWGIERLLKCGLAKGNVNKETGELLYKFTWWTNTLFFPFYDNEGNITYIQGRTLNPGYEKTYKYVNLSEIETVPFNLPVLNELQKNDKLLIAEGVTDCISSCLMGKNAIGIIGAHGFKKKYAELLADYRIYVIPDNDKNKTGEKFAEKIRKEFASIGKTITILPLEKEYKDISEYFINKWNHGEIN